MSDMPSLVIVLVGFFDLVEVDVTVGVVPEVVVGLIKEAVRMVGV